MAIILDPPNFLTIKRLAKAIDENEKIQLSADAIANIENCRKFLDEKSNSTSLPVYGINTGFGSLCNVLIPEEELQSLQENLVMSHACGMGKEVPSNIVKLMLLLKIQNFIYGKSGISAEVTQRLQYFYNNQILPVIYQQGSLGASGDLAPLAHLSLPLIGKGVMEVNQKTIDAKVWYSKSDLKPLILKSKEGLALLNGTQFMSAYACNCLMEAEKIMQVADLCAAFSLEAFLGRSEPFSPPIHSVRGHKGQAFTAKQITEWTSGSQIRSLQKEAVQDPYSFRCVPQVHGATRDVIAHVQQIVETEINSVTDNPTIFPELDLIISGGNFHGQPLALGLDYLALGIAELGNISERRLFQLISGSRGLPPFLTREAGTHSGFMITQYTAASIVSRNKQFCTPASVDSIVSSNGQEDHVSMGANAAVKCYDVIENTWRVLALEFFAAAQAFEFRRPLRSSDFLEDIFSRFRKDVEFIVRDKVMFPEIEKSLNFVRKIKL